MASPRAGPQRPFPLTMGGQPHTSTRLPDSLTLTFYFLGQIGSFSADAGG